MGAGHAVSVWNTQRSFVIRCLSEDWSPAPRDREIFSQIFLHISSILLNTIVTDCALCFPEYKINIQCHHAHHQEILPIFFSYIRYDYSHRHITMVYRSYLSYSWTCVEADDLDTVNKSINSHLGVGPMWYRCSFY